MSALRLPTRSCLHVHTTRPVPRTLDLRYRRTLVLAGLLASLWANESTSLGDSPKVMSLITDTGVLIGRDQLVSLPPPILDGDLGTEQRQKRLKELAGGAGWKRFSRNSAVAPVAIDLKYLKDLDGNRIGHLIHIAFVVHADLDTLQDMDMMKQMFGEVKEIGEAEGIQSHELASEKLDVLGIERDELSSYVAVQLPLLERVLVRGVLHLQQMVDSDSINVAWHLDPRFNNDDEINNAWARIEKEIPADSNALLWLSFQGCGGYLSVYRLNEVPGASLIEVRMVLHEPSDWFHGSNRLRSKLPLMLQEIARDFRRKLK